MDLVKLSTIEVMKKKIITVRETPMLQLASWRNVRLHCRARYKVKPTQATLHRWWPNRTFSWRNGCRSKSLWRTSKRLKSWPTSMWSMWMIPPLWSADSWSAPHNCSLYRPAVGWHGLSSSSIVPSNWPIPRVCISFTDFYPFCLITFILLSHLIIRNCCHIELFT